MGRAVPAVSRALDILELFLDQPTLSAPQITEKLDLPRTTAHELVTTLTDRGYLESVAGAPVRYRLGMRLRIPAWCKNFTVDGAAMEPHDGYVRINRDWGDSTPVVLDLDLPTRIIAAHPRVDAVRGCVALARGPLVYCLEQTDLPGSVALEDARLDVSARIEPAALPSIPVALITTGTVRRPTSPDLYHEHESTGDSAPYVVPLTAVPYYLWGNRAPGPMRVWVPIDAR